MPTLTGCDPVCLSLMFMVYSLRRSLSLMEYSVDVPGARAEGLSETSWFSSVLPHMPDMV
jgi:hypothetical protein